MARAFGWTMNEVRGHTTRDVDAYAALLIAERRQQRMAESTRKARGKR